MRDDLIQTPARYAQFGWQPLAVRPSSLAEEPEFASTAMDFLLAAALVASVALAVALI